MNFKKNIFKIGLAGCMFLFLFSTTAVIVDAQFLNEPVLPEGSFGGSLLVSGNSFNSAPASNGGREETLVQCKTADDCDFDAFMKTFKRIVDLLLKIAVGFSTIIFAYAGFLYLTAGGNPGKRTQANNMITAAVVGFFIAAAAWLLVEVFINTLGGNSEVIKVKEFNFKK